MKASRHERPETAAEAGARAGEGIPGRVSLTQHLAPEPAAASPRAAAGEDGGGGAAAPAGDGMTEGAQEELEGSGEALEGGIREKMEQRFGASLAAVRIHTSAQAAQVVAQKGARAFTYKNHIAFAAGAYSPATPEGEALLAHELTHVVQSGATSARAKVPEASAAGGPHEAEADRNAQRTHQTATGGGRDATRQPGAGGAGGAGGEPGKDGAGPAYESSERADPERRHQCCGGGGAAPPAITLSPVTITVTQAAAALSQRGSAEYKVRWSVGGGKNGWVVQHVKFQGAIQNAAGTAVAANNSGLEYWEGWQVRNGNVFVGSSANAHQADTFRTVSEAAKTKGQVAIIGKVAFIEGYNLAEPPWGHTVAAAGALPTMTSAPDGWSDGAAQDHTMRVNYDDIAGTPQTQVGTP